MQLATPNQVTRELTIRSMSQLIQEVDIHIGWFGLLPQLVGHSDFTDSVIRTWNFGSASPQPGMHVPADSTRHCFVLVTKLKSVSFAPKAVRFQVVCQYSLPISDDRENARSR
jgi:hypothetical protein